MKRILFAVVLATTLAACSSNDKRVNAEETQAVYMTTRLMPATSGGKAYIGPHINSMDDENTYQMYNLSSVVNSQGVASYQLVVLLTYYKKYRYYESANVNNKPSSTFKVISREEGVCAQEGCAFKELLGIDMSEQYLQGHVEHGFEVAISSKVGNKSVLYVPGPYIKGFLAAMKGKK